MKYNAFISYKHSELDMYVAKTIHKKLETFKVPRSVSEKLGKKKIERVFRDQEELPIGSDLADNILHALQESEYLIVICSPRTPESYWVQKEIESFIKIHGRRNILAVLVEGEPSESFPSQLLTGDNGEPVEPLAADVRGSSKGEIQKKIKTEIVRLAAALLGCNYDELRQRHRERKMKKALWCTVSVASLALAFGGYSVYNAMMIEKNYRGKQINQSKYLADTALSLIDEGDRITAGMIALEALPSKDNNRPYVAEAQYALNEALNVYDNGNVIEKDCLLKHDSPIYKFSYSSDGMKLVSVDQMGTVYVWDVEKSTLITKIGNSEISEYDYSRIAYNAVISKEDKLVIAIEDKVFCFDMSGEAEWTWKSENENFYIGCEFDIEAGIAAMISANSVDFINMSDGSHIGEMKNTSQNSTFTSQAVFNDSHDKFAVSHINENHNTDKAKVSIYDLNTSSKTDCTVSDISILDHKFCQDGNIVVLSIDWKKASSLTEYDIDCYVEKIDISSGEKIWVNTIRLNSWQFSMNSAGAVLKCRNYLDNNTKEQHDEVLLSIDNMVYVWNGINGEIVSNISVMEGISAFLVSAVSGYGYVVENSGVLKIFNLTTGKSDSDAIIDIGKNVSNVLLKNGVLAVDSVTSPDIMLMKYHVGKDMEEISGFKENIIGIDYSSDESCYAVKTEESNREGKYYFYSSKDNSALEEWDIDNDGIIIDSCFINESVYVAVCENGKVYFYDVIAGEEISLLEPDEEMTASMCSFSENKKYVFVYSDYYYFMADLQKQKIISQKEPDIVLTGGVITDDGDLFYGSTEDNSLVRIGIKTGDTDFIDTDFYKVTSEDMNNKLITISPNGKLLAVSCMDNKIRILNTKNMKTIEEIEFYAHNRCFIGFTDDNKIIMQADTFYYRVYDIKNHKFVYVSKEQYNMIQKIIYGNKSKNLCLITADGMIILNKKDYNPLAYVEGGIAYMPENGYVFNMYMDTIYRFPYMDMDMLIKEAKNQFGNAELTEQQKIQYNID